MSPALIILLAAVSGYFSLMETALIECHRGRLEKLSDDGDADAKAVLELIESPSALTVAQIGITFTGILAGVCAVLSIPQLADVLDDYIEQEQIISAIIALSVTTFIFLLFASPIQNLPHNRQADDADCCAFVDDCDGRGVRLRHKHFQK